MLHLKETIMIDKQKEILEEPILIKDEPHRELILDGDKVIGFKG